MRATSTYTPSYLSILRRGLTDPWFLVLVPLALLFFVLLVGYSPNDPGWTTSGVNPQVQHFAGKLGAYTADILLSFLGYAAYLLPIGMLAIAWSSAKYEVGSSEMILWKSVGLLGAILSLTGILTFHWQSAINPIAITGGGIIGQKISSELLALMPVFPIMFIYTLVFLVAMTLIFNIKWLSFFGALGYFPAKVLKSAFETHQEKNKSHISPEEAQAQRDSLSSRLKSQDFASAHVETHEKVESSAAQTIATTVDEAPVSATKEKTLAEHLAHLAAKKQSNEAERLSEMMGKIEAAPHRHEPMMSWEDYKLERVNSASAVVVPPHEAKMINETRAKAAPNENKDNPFAAYDAFASESAQEEAETSVAAEEDFFADDSIVATASVSAPMLEAKAENDAASLRIRSGALKTNFTHHAEKSDGYHLPALSLLKPCPPKRTPSSESQFQLLAPLVEAALQNYRLDVRVVGVDVGPVVTRLELELAPGIKVSQLTNLDKDLARSLSVPSVRVVEVIPGKPYVGLEIPNKHREIVHLREILESSAYQQEKSPLTVVLGADIAGAPKVANLAKMPHLLVAGTTGSGKSVAINVMLASMLYKATPEELKLILIDPKMLEMSMYEDIPHLLTPVVTDMNDAENALRWAVAEMERRYMLMAAFKVRNIMGFNQSIREKQARGERIDDPLWRAEEHLGLANQPPQISTLPYIVIVIDELSDMMMAVGKKVEELIARIAQKARAAGIHLILATQRPSVDVITGLIKANVPTRLAFQVSSKIDSRTIIDGQGAETLLGHGDGLYVPPGSSAPLRVHGAFIEDGEVDALTSYLKAQAKPQYEESITNPVPASAMGAFGAQEKSDDPELDPLYDEACQIVIESGKTSISYLQRRLQIGYNRAARIVEAMESAGLLSAADANGARKLIGGNQDDY